MPLPFTISEAITLNRIRSAIQADSSLPKPLVHYNLLRLVNDINAMGGNIPLKNGRGDWRSVEDLAEEVAEFVPNVEQSCRITKQRKGPAVQKAIIEMARKMNSLFGANILIHKNGDPKAGYRTADKICDDMYMVADKQFRALSDSVPLVKGALLKQIQDLEIQRKLLQSRFASLIGSLQGGKNMDQAREAIKEAAALEEAMTSYMGAELKHAKDQYGFLTDEYSKIVRPKLGELTEFLANISKRNYTGSEVGKSLMLEDLIRVYSKLGLGYNVCHECMKRFELRLQDYMVNGEFKAEKFSQDLRDKYDAAKLRITSSDSPTALQDFQVISNCYQSLIQDIKDCQASYAPGEILRHMLVNVDCKSLDTAAECGHHELFCEWDATANVCNPREDDEIRNKLSEHVDNSLTELRAIMGKQVSDDETSSDGKYLIKLDSSAAPTTSASAYAAFGGNPKSNLFETGIKGY